MSRKCKKNVTTDDRGTFKKVLDADKDPIAWLVGSETGIAPKA